MANRLLLSALGNPRIEREVMHNPVAHRFVAGE
jgi:hypothetical protein